MPSEIIFFGSNFKNLSSESDVRGKRFSDSISCLASRLNFTSTFASELSHAFSDFYLSLSLTLETLETPDDAQKILVTEKAEDFQPTDPQRIDSLAGTRPARLQATPRVRLGRLNCSLSVGQVNALFALVV